MQRYYHSVCLDVRGHSSKRWFPAVTVILIYPSLQWDFSIDSPYSIFLSNPYSH